MHNNYGKVFPVTQAVLEGSQAYIQCFSKSKTVWKKDGVIVKSRRIKVGKFLRISKTKLTDTGNWTCHGKVEKDHTFKATSELLVGGSPNIITSNNIIRQCIRYILISFQIEMS